MDIDIWSDWDFRRPASDPTRPPSYYRRRFKIVIYKVMWSIVTPWAEAGGAVEHLGRSVVMMFPQLSVLPSKVL